MKSLPAETGDVRRRLHRRPACRYPPDGAGRLPGAAELFDRLGPDDSPALSSWSDRGSSDSRRGLALLPRGRARSATPIEMRGPIGGHFNREPGRRRPDPADRRRLRAVPLMSMAWASAAAAAVRAYHPSSIPPATSTISSSARNCNVPIRFRFSLRHHVDANRPRRPEFAKGPQALMDLVLASFGTMPRHTRLRLQRLVDVATMLLIDAGIPFGLHQDRPFWRRSRRAATSTRPAGGVILPAPKARVDAPREARWLGRYSTNTVTRGPISRRVDHGQRVTNPEPSGCQLLAPERRMPDRHAIAAALGRAVPDLDVERPDRRGL